MELHMFWITIYLIFGAVFGSFLNVVIFRIPQKDSISYPPSHCMECGHALRFRDLIPIFSWITLKGRCRYCNEKISKQYPMIESLTAASFLLFYIVYQVSIESLILCIITLFFLPLAVIDFKYQILPNKIQMGLGAFALLLAFLHNQYPIFLYASENPMDPIYGASIGGGTLLFVFFLGYFLYHKKQVMGMGDVKLFLVIGLLSGFQHTLMILLCAILITAFVGILLIASGKKHRSDKLAFGPFIIFSFYLVILTPVIMERLGGIG